VTTDVAPRFSFSPGSDEALEVDRSIARIYEVQQRNRPAVAATTAAERIEKLRGIERMLLDRREELHATLFADYRKPPGEVDLSEIFPAVSEARHAIRHLRRWMAPRRVSTPLALLGSRSKILYEPKGVVLIISPWNFPINLTFGPLVSAVAAGNCAIIKPSEMTPHASAWMKKVIGELFDENEVAVVEGEAAVATQLLAKKFDHIFFTGSPAVGKIVMKAAAEHLTSVTLELGGKSPVIIDKTANLDEAASKIAWGKFFNSGQICIAPDYLLVDEDIREPFVAKLRATVARGGKEAGGWIVNDRHAARAKRLLDEAVEGGAHVLAGGTFSAGGRAIAPTVLEGVSADSAIMQEEIFGPLLPIVTYRNLDEALAMIETREKPLVLYLFSRSREVIDRVLHKTRSGGAVVNDTLLHFYQLNLPFGGVGNSGLGKSHGFFGFEAFSNMKGVLEQPTRFSGIQLMYPPYSRFKRKLIEFVVRYL
jgi:aldehyde dehydrogenase (NAD+)